MLALEIRKLVDFLLGKVQIVLGSISVAVGCIMKVDPADAAVFKLDRTVVFVQHWAWVVMIFGPVAVAIVAACRRKYGNPWAWEAVQKVLNAFQQDLAKGRPGSEPMDHHRVTLFRHQFSFRRGKFGRLLVACARSGHLTKGRIESFRVPDHAAKCEGVAGMAWRASDWVIVPPPNGRLPELTQKSFARQVEEYARHTNMTPGWVNNRLKCQREFPLCLAGIAVQAGGSRWGVIVIDSKEHGMVTAETLSRFNPYAIVLKPLLERI